MWRAVPTTFVEESILPLLVHYQILQTLLQFRMGQILLVYIPFQYYNTIVDASVSGADSKDNTVGTSILINHNARTIKTT